MDYQSLTQDQHAQVAHDFADDLFGSDPAAFDYAVNNIGQVISRTPLDHGQPGRISRGKVQVSITMREETNITEDMVRRANAAISMLAADILKQILQNPKDDSDPP